MLIIWTWIFWTIGSQTEGEFLSRRCSFAIALSSISTIITSRCAWDAQRVFKGWGSLGFSRQRTTHCPLHHTALSMNNALYLETKPRCNIFSGYCLLLHQKCGVVLRSFSSTSYNDTVLCMVPITHSRPFSSPIWLIFVRLLAIWPISTWKHNKQKKSSTSYGIFRWVFIQVQVWKYQYWVQNTHVTLIKKKLYLCLFS